MREKILWIVSLVFCLTIAGFSQQPSELSQLINLAVKNNPDYQAALARVAAEEKGIKPAGTLPDPKLGFALANLPTNSFVFDQEPMTGKKISLMQQFPFPGKLGLKSDMARFSYLQAKFQSEEMKNNLIRQVKKLYFQIYLMNKSIEIVEKNRKLLNEMKNIAETKYSVGHGLQQDVLKAHVELSKLSDKLIQLRRMRERAQFDLNKLLNRSLNAPIMADSLPVKQFSAQQLDSLLEQAEQYRPLLKAWQQAVARAKSAEALAKRNYLPDFSLGVAYTQRDDLASGMKMNDFFSAELSLNLPIYFFRKQKPEVQKQQLKTISIQEKFQDIKNQVQFQISDAMSEVQKYDDLIVLYRDGIIPQAQQAFNSALTDYQVDKVDFLTLFSNLMTLFNYELDYYRVQTEKMKSLADLEFGIGRTLAGQ